MIIMFLPTINSGTRAIQNYFYRLSMEFEEVEDTEVLPWHWSLTIWKGDPGPNPTSDNAIYTRKYPIKDWAEVSESLRLLKAIANAP